MQNETKEPISANILIKNSENKTLISEFFRADENGEFTATLEKSYSKIYFDVTAVGYEKITDSIINPIKRKTYSFNYTLQNKTTELEEVIIKEEKFEIEEIQHHLIQKAIKTVQKEKLKTYLKKFPEWRLKIVEL